MIFEIQEESRKLSVINHARGKAGTYPLLSVHASVGRTKGEILLTTKSNAVGLGCCGVSECRDGCLLLLRAELRRETATREMSGKVQGTRSEGIIR